MLRLLSALLTCACLCSAALAQDAPPYDPYADIVISSAINDLPAPVRATRQKLIEAARNGRIEALAPIIAAQSRPPNVSFGDPDDPIEYLKSTSADKEGREALTILGKLLEAPYTVIGATSDDPSYVWPYLAALGDLNSFTPRQEADARRLLSEEEYANLEDFGGWFYWRVFIGKAGDWRAFVAGD